MFRQNIFKLRVSKGLYVKLKFIRRVEFIENRMIIDKINTARYRYEKNLQNILFASFKIKFLQRKQSFIFPRKLSSRVEFRKSKGAPSDFRQPIDFNFRRKLKDAATRKKQRQSSIHQFVLFLVRYVLAFLATTAPPHRPLHHAKPTITTTNTTVTTANSTSASTIAPVKRSPVKHSVHTTVHPTSGAAAAARPERGVKDLSQRYRGANDEAQAKLVRGHPAAAAAAAGDDPSSKSSSDTRSASNRAATTVVQASK